jgi:hypothetical protein
MNDSTNFPIDAPKIRNNPQIKLLKKNARQRSLLENLEDESFHDLDELMGSAAQEDHILDENKDIRHLKGKFERFRLDRSKRLIYKDILVIQPNGKVIIRSSRNMYFGEARYLLNSMLQINVSTLNEEQEIPLTLLSYVGRYEFQEISCLHTLCLTASPDNQPVSHYELLVPILNNDLYIVPQMIDVDSLEFMKLRHRYPELYNNLLRPLTSLPSKVEW